MHLNCRNCGKQIEQKALGRKRVYCDDRCKETFYRKTSASAVAAIGIGAGSVAGSMLTGYRPNFRFKRPGYGLVPRHLLVDGKISPRRG